MPITISRSKRPGRRSAGSSELGRLVAPITMICPRPSMPSISVSSCATTRFSTSPTACSRFGAIESISSMKTMLGAPFLACSKIWRSLASLSPELVDDLRPAQRQKRRVGLAGHRAREQGLAAAGRPVQQDAPGCVDPEAGEDFRVAQWQLDHFAHAVEGAAESADVFVRQPAGGRLGARCVEPDQRIAANDDHAARRRLDDAEFLEARSEGRDANPVAGDDRHVDQGPGDSLRGHAPDELAALRRQDDPLRRHGVDHRHRDPLADHRARITAGDAVDRRPRGRADRETPARPSPRSASCR